MSWKNEINDPDLKCLFSTYHLGRKSRALLILFSSNPEARKEAAESFEESGATPMLLKDVEEAPIHPNAFVYTGGTGLWVAMKGQEQAQIVGPFGPVDEEWMKSSSEWLKIAQKTKRVVVLVYKGESSKEIFEEMPGVLERGEAIGLVVRARLDAISV